MTKECYTVDEFCDRFSIGRTKAYEFIKSGDLPSIKVGSRRLILAQGARNLLNLLIAETALTELELCNDAPNEEQK